MRVLFFGNTGTGKTKHMVYNMINLMLDTCYGTELFNSYDEIDRLNMQGFNISKNFEHLCFSNFYVNTLGFKIPSLESYLINPFRIGLYDKNYKTYFYPPYVQFFITELQIYYPSDKWDMIRSNVKQYWQTARQYGVSLTADCQRPLDVAKPIRELFDLFIEHLEVQEVVKNGKLVHRWLVRIIKGGNRVLEEYLRTNKSELYEEKYIYSDDIYHNNYDTNMLSFLHTEHRENQDIDVNLDVLDTFKCPDNFFINNKKNINNDVEIL